MASGFDEAELRSIIKGILISTPESLRVHQLNRDFRENEGYEFPYSKLGFPSFLAYLKSVPDTVKLQDNSSNPIVVPVATEKTSHIDKLVLKQNKKTTRRGLWVPPRRSVTGPTNVSGSKKASSSLPSKKSPKKSKGSTRNSHASPCMKTCKPPPLLPVTHTTSLDHALKSQLIEFKKFINSSNDLRSSKGEGRYLSEHDKFNSGMNTGEKVLSVKVRSSPSFDMNRHSPAGKPSQSNIHKNSPPSLLDLKIDIPAHCSYGGNAINKNEGWGSQSLLGPYQGNASPVYSPGPGLSPRLANPPREVLHHTSGRRCEKNNRQSVPSPPAGNQLAPSPNIPSTGRGCGDSNWQQVQPHSAGNQLAPSSNRPSPDNGYSSSRSSPFLEEPHFRTISQPQPGKTTSRLPPPSMVQPQASSPSPRKSPTNPSGPVWGRTKQPKEVYLPAGCESSWSLTDESDIGDDKSSPPGITTFNKRKYSEMNESKTSELRINPETINNVDEDDDNTLVSERMKSNFRTILKKNPQGVFCADLPQLYEKEFKVTLNYKEYGFSSIIDMVSKLKSVFSYSKKDKNSDWLLVPADPNITRTGVIHRWIPRDIIQNIVKLLSRYPQGLVSEKLIETYEMFYNKSIDLNRLGFDSLTLFLASLKNEVHQRKVRNITLLYCKGKNFQDEFLFGVDLYSKPDKPALPDEQKLQKLHRSLYPEEVCGPDDVIPVQEIPSVTENNRYLEVRVSEAETPAHFWVQLGSMSEKLEAMMDDLDIFYLNEEANYKMPEVTIKKGLLCACIYSLVNRWHRAIIRDVISKSFSSSPCKVQIEYIDYGTITYVEGPILRFLHKDFMPLPAQALTAKLLSIKPPAGEREWPLSSCRLLNDLTFNKRLVFEAHTINNEEHYLEGIIYDTNGHEDIVINDELVHRGFASFVTVDQPISPTPISSNDTPEPPNEPIVQDDMNWNHTSSGSQYVLDPETDITTDLGFETDATTVISPITTSSMAGNSPEVVASSSTNTTFMRPPPGFPAKSTYESPQECPQNTTMPTSTELNKIDEAVLEAVKEQSKQIQMQIQNNIAAYAAFNSLKGWTNVGASTLNPWYSPAQCIQQQFMLNPMGLQWMQWIQSNAAAAAAATSVSQPLAHPNLLQPQLPLFNNLPVPYQSVSLTPQQPSKLVELSGISSVLKSRNSTPPSDCFSENSVSIPSRLDNVTFPASSLKEKTSQSLSSNEDSFSSLQNARCKASPEKKVPKDPDEQSFVRENESFLKPKNQSTRKNCDISPPPSQLVESNNWTQPMAENKRTTDKSKKEYYNFTPRSSSSASYSSMVSIEEENSSVLMNQIKSNSTARKRRLRKSKAKPCKKVIESSNGDTTYQTLSDNSSVYDTASSLVSETNSSKRSEDSSKKMSMDIPIPGKKSTSAGSEMQVKEVSSSVVPEALPISKECKLEYNSVYSNCSNTSLPEIRDSKVKVGGKESWDESSVVESWEQLVDSPRNDSSKSRLGNVSRQPVSSQNSGERNRTSAEKDKVDLESFKMEKKVKKDKKKKKKTESDLSSLRSRLQPNTRTQTNISNSTDKCIDGNTYDETEYDNGQSSCQLLDTDSNYGDEIYFSDSQIVNEDTDAKSTLINHDKTNDTKAGVSCTDNCISNYDSKIMTDATGAAGGADKANEHINKSGKRKNKVKDIDIHNLTMLIRSKLDLNDWKSVKGLPSDEEHPKTFKDTERARDNNSQLNALDKVIMAMKNIQGLQNRESTEKTMENQPTNIKKNSVSQRVIQDRNVHVFWVNDQPVIATDEMIHLFTKFTKRHAVNKVLDSRQAAKPYFDISKKTNGNLFDMLNEFSLEGIQKKGNVLPDKLSVLPLRTVPSLLEILGVDSSIISGFNELINEFDTITTS